MNFSLKRVALAMTWNILLTVMLAMALPNIGQWFLVAIFAWLIASYAGDIVIFMYKGKA